MNWIKLEHLLLKALPGRVITDTPALDHAQLREQALSIAAGLQARGVQRMAVHLEDAADLAIALQPQLVTYLRQGLNDKISMGESEAHLQSIFAPAPGG